MNEIKYRVWNESQKEYQGSGAIKHYGKNVWGIEAREFEKIELSSGLLDGAGRTIYDGDILQDEDGYLWTVSYNEEDAMFQLSDGSVAENFGNVSSKWFMIIGNLNENKEILE